MAAASTATSASWPPPAGWVPASSQPTLNATRITSSTARVTVTLGGQVPAA
jgi:hypothetical protein